MRRGTTQRLRTDGCQGFEEAWHRGGHVTHNCRADGNLAEPRPAHHTDASPPLVSVVEASTGRTTKWQSCAPSVDSGRGDLTGLGTLELKLNEVAPKEEGSSHCHHAEIKVFTGRKACCTQWRTCIPSRM